MGEVEGSATKADALVSCAWPFGPVIVASICLQLLVQAPAAASTPGPIRMSAIDAAWSYLIAPRYELSGLRENREPLTLPAE
jgi:hypothetical protein